MRLIHALLCAICFATSAETPHEAAARSTSSLPLITDADFYSEPGTPEAAVEMHHVVEAREETDPHVGAPPEEETNEVEPAPQSRCQRFISAVNNVSCHRFISAVNNASGPLLAAAVYVNVVSVMFQKMWGSSKEKYTLQQDNTVDQMMMQGTVYALMLVPMIASRVEDTVMNPEIAHNVIFRAVNLPFELMHRLGHLFTDHFWTTMLFFTTCAVISWNVLRDQVAGFKGADAYLAWSTDGYWKTADLQYIFPDFRYAVETSTNIYKIFIPPFETWRNDGMFGENMLLWNFWLGKGLKSDFIQIAMSTLYQLLPLTTMSMQIKFYFLHKTNRELQGRDDTSVWLAVINWIRDAAQLEDRMQIAKFVGMEFGLFLVMKFRHKLLPDNMLLQLPAEVLSLGFFVGALFANAKMMLRFQYYDFLVKSIFGVLIGCSMVKLVSDATVQIAHNDIGHVLWRILFYHLIMLFMARTMNIIKWKFPIRLACPYVQPPIEFTRLYVPREPAAEQEPPTEALHDAEPPAV